VLDALPRCRFGVIRLENDERNTSERTTDPREGQKAKIKLATPEGCAISAPGAWLFWGAALLA
jgi:hypothetical protein